MTIDITPYLDEQEKFWFPAGTELDFDERANAYRLVQGPAFDAWVEDMRRNQYDCNLGPVVLSRAECKILDGRNRYRVARAAGVPFLASYLREGEDVEGFIRRANDHRRHESPEEIAERKANIRRLRSEGHSLRGVAEQAGVSLATVQRTLEGPGVPGDTPAAEPAPKPRKVLGRDGKEYEPSRSEPAPKPRKNGKPVYDWKRGAEAYRALAREIDAVGVAAGLIKMRGDGTAQEESPELEYLRGHLADFWSMLKDAYQKATGNAAPGQEE